MRTRIPHLFILVILAFMLFFSTSFGMQATDLNQATVRIPDHSAPSRQHAFETAYAAVMIKQSGNTAIMTLPEIQKPLTMVQNYVERYAYLEEPLRLNVVFNAASIYRLLAHARQPIWHGERPTTLIVLIVSPESFPQKLFEIALHDAAEQRGLNILFSDENTQNTGVFTMESAKELTKRYNVPSVLAGFITNTHVRWLWWQNNRISEWNITPTDPYPINAVQQIAHLTMDHLLETLASQHALFTSVTLQRPVLIKINNMNNFEDYKRITALLHQLPGVNEVNLQRITDHYGLFQIKIAGASEALLEALQHQTQITTNNPTANFLESPVLECNWHMMGIGDI